MSELFMCPNGYHWAPSSDHLFAADGPETVCPVCGRTGEVAPEDFVAELREAEEEMPPPPRPVPAAVAQVALGGLGPAGTWLPTITGYEILGRLGRGGMGVVFRARQIRLGRVVALKVILAGVGGDPKELARFRTETETVARLQHPNIVQIYEVGEQDGWAYCALEYVEGGSLARKLAGRPHPALPAVQLAEALAPAVPIAHDHGIVHRDLKPANSLLPEDRSQRTEARGEQRLERSGFHPVLWLLSSVLYCASITPVAGSVILGHLTVLERVEGISEVQRVAVIQAEDADQ